MIAMAALWIKLANRGPVFYRQMREGLAGRRIPVWKLRTMRTGGDRIRINGINGWSSIPKTPSIGSALSNCGTILGCCPVRRGEIGSRLPSPSLLLYRLGTDTLPIPSLPIPR